MPHWINMTHEDRVAHGAQILDFLITRRGHPTDRIRSPEAVRQLQNHLTYTRRAVRRLRTVPPGYTGRCETWFGIGLDGNPFFTPPQGDYTAALAAVLKDLLAYDRAKEF